MKKIMKSLCSVLCMLGLSVPLNALAAPAEEIILDEQVEQSGEPDLQENYHLAFLTGDFGLKYNSGQLVGNPVDSLLLFVSNPQGKIVKNAQVIYTIIDPAGEQQMSRARPYKGGYVVAIQQLNTGHYRLETEVITDGQLLTDEFSFVKS